MPNGKKIYRIHSYEPTEFGFMDAARTMQHFMEAAEKEAKKESHLNAVLVMRNLNATVVYERHQWICATLFRLIKPEENGIQNLKPRYKMQSLIAMYSQYPEKGKVKFNCPRLRTALQVFALFFHFLLPSLAMPWFACFNPFSGWIFDRATSSASTRFIFGRFIIIALYFTDMI